MSQIKELLAKRPIPKEKKVVEIKISDVVDVDAPPKVAIPSVRGVGTILDDDSISPEEIGITMPQKAEPEKSRFQILDKRQSDFDVSSFLSKVGKKSMVVKKIPVVERKPIGVEEGDIDMPDIVGPVEEESKAAIKVPTRIKLKKLPKKLKITPSEKAVTKTLRIRKTKKPDFNVVAEDSAKNLEYGKKLRENIIIRDSPQILAPTYFLNNRQIFMNSINKLFLKYGEDLKKESEDITCESRGSGVFSLLTHQKIVKDYLNLYTPYRGLLLYHGLGSGKTCSSIAIAEGMKTSKKIIVMTPASLRMNYIEELKKCGDSLYKKNQFWQFVSIQGKDPEFISALADVLSLDKSYITKKGGAWMVNMKEEPNYESLDTESQTNIDKQLNEMIFTKYNFINYNGLRYSSLNKLTLDGTINPFDNKVVIIDEAHNFISRIVNKLGKVESLSYNLYNLLMEATNCRVVLLSGTPIINYPNEMAIMFNILRGFIKSWSFKLDVPRGLKVDQSYFESPEMLGKYAILDYLEYNPSRTTLTVTRNPFGFVSSVSKRTGEYKGVKQYKPKSDSDTAGEKTDEEFISYIRKRLEKHGFKISAFSVKPQIYKALPDTLDDFPKVFH